MPTISIGSRERFSISSTRTGVVGWKRFLPLTSASARPSRNHAGWANALRARYSRGLRRERAAFVWLRRLAASPFSQHLTSRREHHSHAWRLSPVTHLHLALAIRRDRSSAPSRSMAAGAVRPAAGPRPARLFLARNVKPRMEVAHPRVSTQVTRRLRVERRRREEEARSTLRTLRIESHRIERSEVHNLARRIVARAQRVEQLPPRRAPQEISRIAAPPPRAAVASVSRHVPAETARIESQPMSASERPAAPPLNIEALADTVLRQIDRRLIAQRERTGRF